MVGWIREQVGGFWRTGGRVKIGMVTLLIGVRLASDSLCAGEVCGLVSQFDGFIVALEPTFRNAADPHISFRGERHRQAMVWAAWGRHRRARDERNGLRPYFGWVDALWWS